VDQGRLVAVRGRRGTVPAWQFPTRGRLPLRDTVGIAALASWGDPRSATGSWMSGLRPAEGGPWWLYWTEGRAAESRSRFAPGPQAGSRRCLGGGPVRLLRVLGTSQARPFGAEAQYGMKPRMGCAGTAPRLWIKCVVSPSWGSCGSEEQCS
jgi:hypothetical protein